MTRTRLLTALATLAAGLTLAGTGTALAVTDDGGRPAAVTPVRAPVTGPTAGEAGGIAVWHLGGGRAVRVERELEHGPAVWDVAVQRATGLVEVHVDAATGAVSRVEDRTRGDDRSDGRSDDGHGGDDRSHGRHGGR